MTSSRWAEDVAGALDLCRSGVTSADSAVALQALKKLLHGYAREFEVDREEAVTQVLVKALTPQTIIRALAFPTAHREAAVRSWLKVAVRRAALDGIRKEHGIEARRKELQHESAGRHASATDEGLVTREERLRARELLDIVVEKTAAGFKRAPAREEFLATWKEVVLLAEEETTIDALVEKSGATATALYKRHSRARERVVKMMRRLEKSNELTAEDAAVVFNVVDRFLRKCQSGRRPASSVLKKD